MKNYAKKLAKYLTRENGYVVLKLGESIGSADSLNVKELEKVIKPFFIDLEQECEKLKKKCDEQGEIISWEYGVYRSKQNKL